MNKNINKTINIIKKYIWIIILIYIYLFTSLISSINEKTLEFNKINLNADKISYFSSNNTKNNTTNNTNKDNNKTENKDNKTKEEKEKEENDIAGNIGRSYKIDQSNPMSDFLGNIGTGIGHILNGVLGIIFMVLYLPIVIMVISIMSLLTILLQDSNKEAGAGEAKSGWLLTPDKIFMNKVPITNIEIFINGSLAEKTKLSGFVNAIASWYRVIFLISIAILFFILIYLSIRAMVASLAKDIAEIKMMFLNWIKSVMILFLMIFIIVGVITLNSAFVSIITQSMVNESNALENQVMGLVAGILSFNFIRETISLTILFILIFQTLSFLSVYVKRLITVGFYILIAPIISVAYAIDVVGDKKAQSMRNWLKKFMGLVFVQPFHLLLYAIFAGTVFRVANASGGPGGPGGVVTFTPGGLNFGLLILILAFFKFFKEAEEILKEMFQFDKEVSLSKGAGFAKMIMYDQGFKRLEKMGSKKKEGENGESAQKPIYIKAKEMFASKTTKTGTGSSQAQGQSQGQTQTQSSSAGSASNATQSTGETKAKNKFLETLGKTKNKVFNNKAAKAVKNTYVFAGKHIAPAIIGGAIGYSIADKNPIDEIIAGGLAGHTIMNKGIIPGAKNAMNKINLHNNYGDNAKKSSDNVEEQLHNIEKITGQNFDNSTVEGKQNISNFLEQIKSKMDNGQIMSELSSALDKYREYLMKFEGKTKFEADLLVTKKLNELKENKIDYTNIEGPEKDLAIAYNQTKVASEISEFNTKNAAISGDFRDVESILLSGGTKASGNSQEINKREEYREFKNEINEVISEMKTYMEKNEKLKEDIEMMKRAGLDKEEVMQKYEKVQKKVEVFKTKVEKRTLKTDITDKEREEYEKLITRIEKNELSSIKEDEYKTLVLDTFEGNTRNEGNKEENGSE